MNAKRRSRTSICLAGMATAMTVAALHAAPALGSAGSGDAAIVVADHSKGRTLSGQGVKLIAGEGATGGASGKLTLPIAELEPGAQPSAQTTGTLEFKRGKKGLALTGIRFDLSTATLTGKLGGVEMPVFRLGGVPAVNSVAGSISLSEGKLRLTKEAASALKQKLGLAQALKNNGVGMIWLAAKANPTHAAPRPVVSGSVSWGVLASWRKYVITDSAAPGPDEGEVTVSGGASANGNLVEPSGFFGFPVVKGSYEKGLYGGADRLTLSTQGAAKFAKPAHCINEVLFSGIELELDGGASAIRLDAKNEIGKFNGMGCEAQPPVPTADVVFGTLTPVASTSSGNTVTWSAIPAVLTAAGSTAWGAGPPYVAGKALDAITITVGLG